MKIVSLTMVYNEADILELFVRHHVRFVDEMILILHGKSTDRTEEIALQLKAEGLPVTLEYSDVPAYEQSSILTETAHRAVGLHQPDLLIPLDCDEFLCAEEGTSVRTALESLPADRITALPWRTYIPKTPNSSLVESMSHRRKKEEPQYCKVLIPRAFFQPSLIILQGSHGIILENQMIPSSVSTTLWLAHLPIRSPKQAYQKALHAWPRQRDNPRGRPGDCFQWQMLYEAAGKHAAFTQEQVVELALRYASDDTNATPEVVYDPFGFYLGINTLADRDGGGLQSNFS